MTMTRRGKTFRDLVNDAKTRIKEVTIDELKQWLSDKKDIVIVDVREQSDYAAGCVPGAVHCSRGVLELDIDDVVPDQNKTIITVCGGGSRSALAADTLQVMGYENVYSLAGGYKGWKQAE